MIWSCRDGELGRKPAGMGTKHAGMGKTYLLGGGDGDRIVFSRHSTGEFKSNC